MTGLEAPALAQTLPLWGLHPRAGQEHVLLDRVGHLPRVGTAGWDNGPHAAPGLGRCTSVQGALRQGPQMDAY